MNVCKMSEGEVSDCVCSGTCAGLVSAGVCIRVNGAGRDLDRPCFLWS